MAAIAPYVIEGHPTYKQAATPNRVALYISGDVMAPWSITGHSPTLVAQAVAELKIGQTFTFTASLFGRHQGVSDQVHVTRNL
jgi:hypothetical protein